MFSLLSISLLSFALRLVSSPNPGPSGQTDGHHPRPRPTPDRLSPHRLRLQRRRHQLLQPVHRRPGPRLQLHLRRPPAVESHISTRRLAAERTDLIFQRCAPSLLLSAASQIPITPALILPMNPQPQSSASSTPRPKLSSGPPARTSAHSAPRSGATVASISPSPWSSTSSARSPVSRSPLLNSKRSTPTRNGPPPPRFSLAVGIAAGSSPASTYGIYRATHPPTLPALAPAFPHHSPQPAGPPRRCPMSDASLV